MTEEDLFNFCTTCDKNIIECDLEFCRMNNHVFTKMIKPNSIKLKEEKEKPKHSEIAKSIMVQHNFKTLQDTKEILVYQEGVYAPFGEIIIAKESQLRIEECNKHDVSEVEGNIQRETFRERELFNSDLSKLVLENGIIDLKTLTLSEFSSEYLSTIKIPINTKAQINTIIPIAANTILFDITNIIIY